MHEQPSAPARGGRRQTKAVGRRHRGARSRTAQTVARSATAKPSTGTRIRYRLDNALSRGAWVVIGYLGLVTLAIVLVAAVFAVILRLAGFNGGSGPLGLLEAFWQMLVRVVDGGSFAGDTGWWTRIAALLVTLAGIFIAGSLIGLISAAVDQRIDALRRGKSHVIETGHSLILGWSERVPVIVGELVVANESERRAAVVILADRDKTEMEEMIRSFVGDLRTTRLVCRRGDPGHSAALQMVGAPAARSIVVTSDDGDASSIRSALAVLGLGLDGTPIVVEMQSAERADTLEAVTDGSIVTVNSDRVIAEVTAQACRERGLSLVFRELLDFDGDELYFRAFPELDGASYAEVQQSFERAAVLGIATEERLLLNPAPDRITGSGDRVIALVEDDSKFLSDGIRRVPEVTVGDEPDPEPPQRILLVGWSALAPLVIRELDDFLPPGSTITVLVDPKVAGPDVVLEPGRASEGLVHTAVEVRTVEGGPESLGAVLGNDAYDQAILLGYRQGMSPANADAQTLLTLMGLRKRWPKGHPPEVRLVAEVLDQRNVEIAQMAGVDDFIVSDQLASLMIAQLSERIELREVFDELFDAAGASIVLRPARRFVPDGSITFGEIVASGNHFGESVLGYRTAANGRLVLNPGRATRLTLGQNDEIVVVTTR